MAEDEQDALVRDIVDMLRDEGITSLVAVYPREPDEVAIVRLDQPNT